MNHINAEPPRPDPARPRPASANEGEPESVSPVYPEPGPDGTIIPLSRGLRHRLHLTAIAAAWMNIIYGFGGFRSDAGIPSLAPTLPPGWTALCFRIHWQNRRIEVRIDQGGPKIRLLQGESLEIRLYGKLCRLEKAALCPV